MRVIACEDCRQELLRSRLDSKLFAYQITPGDLSYLQEVGQVPKLQELVHGNMRAKKKLLREKLDEYYNKVTVSRCGFMFHQSCIIDKIKRNGICPKCPSQFQDMMDHFIKANPSVSGPPLEVNYMDSTCTIMKKYCLAFWFDLISPVSDILTKTQIIKLGGFFFFMLLNYLFYRIMTSPEPERIKPSRGFKLRFV